MPGHMTPRNCCNCDLFKWSPKPSDSLIPPPKFFFSPVHGSKGSRILITLLCILCILCDPSLYPLPG